jgi:cytochrome c556
MQQYALKSLTCSLALMVTAVLALPSTAAEPEDMIKYRQAVMKSQGGHMGAAAQILKGKVDFGSDLEYHAAALAASSAGLTKLFPKDSDFGVTRAKPEIWTNRAEFEKASNDAEKAGHAFLAAVKSNDQSGVAKAFSDLAEACKGCHKKFREKKE